MYVLCFRNKYQHRITAVNYVNVRITTKPCDIKLYRNVGTLLFKTVYRTATQMRANATNLEKQVLGSDLNLSVLSVFLVWMLIIYLKTQVI
jgi:hypothetical protein